MDVATDNDIDAISDMFAKCNVNKQHLYDKIDDCAFCDHMAYDFMNYPHSHILGLNVCSNFVCIKKAKDTIYNYCLENFHYPITTGLANSFSLLKMYFLTADGKNTVNRANTNNIWILEPYTHTFVENNELYVTIRNTCDDTTHHVKVYELCMCNGIVPDEIIKVFVARLHEFIYSN